MHHSTSSADTHTLGVNLGKELKKGLLCLYGDLGAGKTTFIRGLAEGLGVTSRVQSPTFTYQRIHHGPKVILYHFDCYRLTEPDPLIVQEVTEALERGDGIVAVEWAERIDEYLPAVKTTVHFEQLDEAARRITITTHD